MIIPNDNRTLCPMKRGESKSRSDEVGHIYPAEFYARSTLKVARDLLGQYLVVKDGRARLLAKIVETEAYIGENDPACHAAVGRTKRNAVMYGPPGHAYVYFTYGNHFMLNFVTMRESYPAAVLIRALEPVAGIERMIARRRTDDLHKLCRGPGNLTAALGIDRTHNGLPLFGPKIAVHKNENRRPPIATGGRVGVNEGWEKPWRFFFRDHPGVSVYRKGTAAGRKRLPELNNG